MTPAVQLLKRLKIPHTIHQYEHDPQYGGYGEEAAIKMGVKPERVYKTLIAEIDDATLVVSIVPVSRKLDLKNLAKTCEVKKAKMADKKQVEKTTGYIVGGVSPLGQKKRLRTLIDSRAGKYETIFVSGGKRGLDIELAPEALAELTGASFASLSK